MGSPAAPFRDCADSIHSFAAFCCSFGVTVQEGRPHVYAPFGYDDLFAMIVRPNPRVAPRHVYDQGRASVGAVARAHLLPRDDTAPPGGSVAWRA